MLKCFSMMQWCLNIRTLPLRTRSKFPVMSSSTGTVATTVLWSMEVSAYVLYQGLKKLWNFEARACIGLQKNLDFINKNVTLVIRTPFQKLRFLLY